MAVFNIHEEYWDRPYAGNNNENAIPHTVGVVLGNFFRFVSKLFFRFSRENDEIITEFDGKKTGAVLIAPHVSYWDVIFMFISMRPRGWVRLLGRDNLFSTAGGLLGWVFSSVGAFPIKRAAADKVALKRAAKALKNGEWVGLFPEGTRRGKGSSEPALHGGAALIARMGKAPIIPMGFENAERIKRKGEHPRFPKVTARFGKPYAVASFDFLPKEQRLDGCTWYTMREAYALTYNCPAQSIPMAEIFPDSYDFTAIFAEHPIEPINPAELPSYEA